MSDMKSKAQLDVLKNLRKSAMDDMGESYNKGMKKVSVVSPTQEGLEKGLDKAEDLLSSMPEQEEDYEAKADAKLQELVDMCKSSEDLDHKIAFLQRAKEEKFGSSEPEME